MEKPKKFDLFVKSLKGSTDLYPAIYHLTAGFDNAENEFSDEDIRDVSKYIFDILNNVSSIKVLNPNDKEMQKRI